MFKKDTEPPLSGVLEGPIEYAAQNPFSILFGFALLGGFTIGCIVVVWQRLRLHKISEAQWSRYSWVKPPPQWPPAAFTVSGILMQNVPGLILLLMLLAPLSAIPLLVSKLLDILLAAYSTFAFLQRPVTFVWVLANQLASIGQLVAICASVRAIALSHLAIVLTLLFGKQRALAIEDALESNAGGLVTAGAMVMLPVLAAVGLVVLPRLVPPMRLVLTHLRRLRDAAAEREHVRLKREREQSFQELLARAAACTEHATKFNQVATAIRGISLYGCGALAPAHVGAIRALERHGFDASQVSQ